MPTGGGARRVGKRTKDAECRSEYDRGPTAVDGRQAPTLLSARRPGVGW